MRRGAIRTTLTLDADVMHLLEEAQARQRRPFKQVVNDAIRAGLSPRVGARDGGRYRLQPHAARLRPGFDPAGFNRLADELEDAAVLAKRTR